MSTTYTATEHKQVIHSIVYRLHKQGLTQQQIAEAVEYTQGNVSHIIGKIKAVEETATYQVGRSTGRPAQLSKHQRELLRQTVEQGADKVGFPDSCWTRNRVQLYLKNRFAVTYSLAHISRLMTQLGFSLQQPEVVDDRHNPEQIQYYETQVLPETKKKANAARSLHYLCRRS